MTKVVFRDFFKIDVPGAEKLQEFKDFVSVGGQRGLRVKIEATHAGITNRNNRFYIPSRMRDSAASLLKGKPAPILKHHKEDEDPVGKVRVAEYVDTTPEAIRSLPEVAVLNDAEASLKDQVKAARKFIRSGITKTEDWHGLGNITIYADILDEDTIKQIETGLFDAVSIGFGSNHAFCSICGQDWMEGDSIFPNFCEHYPPGKEYETEDGEKETMFLIPGDMYQRELSLVNFDADPLTNIAVSGYGFGDKEEKETKSFINTRQEDLSSATITWEMRDFEEDQSMPQEPTPAQTVELSDKETAVLNVLKGKIEGVEDASLIQKAKEIAALQGEDGLLPDQKDAGLEDETAILYAYDALTIAGEIDADAVYAELTAELEADAQQDATLSSEQRNRLGTKTFCGPNRSFPVPDCAHVTAARRLIGRYKGPGDKSKILACVNSKAKALGCGGSKDNQPLGPTEIQDSVTLPTCAQVEKISDEEVRLLFHMAEADLIRRNLTVKRECSDCAANLKRATDAEAAKTELDAKVAEADEILTVLRDELKNWAFDYKMAVNDCIDTRVKLDKEMKDHAALVACLSGKQKTLEDATNYFADVPDITTEYTVIMKDFDLGKILDKINDGMHHSPKGTVGDPTRTVAIDNAQLPEGLSKPAQAFIERLRDMVKDDEELEARRVFARMKDTLFDKNTTFESIISTAPEAGE